MITNTLQNRSNYSVDMSVHSDRFIVMSDPTALGPERGIGHLPSAKVAIIIENQPLIKPFVILMVSGGMRTQSCHSICKSDNSSVLRII